MQQGLWGVGRKNRGHIWGRNGKGGYGRGEKRGRGLKCRRWESGEGNGMEEKER